MSFKAYWDLSAQRKKEVLARVAAQNGMLPVALEKDWWVVQTLRMISRTQAGDHFQFKGGTSLSKGWNLIERFSEDVDLGLNPSAFGISTINPTRSGIERLRKVAVKWVGNDWVHEVNRAFKTAGLLEVDCRVRKDQNSDRDPIQIEVFYPSVTESSGYLKPYVLLEISARSMLYPVQHCSFQSIVGEAFESRISLDDLVSFSTVDPMRTFLEKLFLLHEFFQPPQGKKSSYRMSRHYYDLYSLAAAGVGDKALNNHSLYGEIIQHRFKYQRIKGINYYDHFPPRLKPFPPSEERSEWQRDYLRMQEEMIYGASPSFEEIMERITIMIENFNRKNASRTWPAIS